MRLSPRLRYTHPTPGFTSTTQMIKFFISDSTHEVSFRDGTASHPTLAEGNSHLGIGGVGVNLVLG